MLNTFELPSVERLRGFFRLQSLHAAHPEARARERHRRATFTAAAAVTSRIVGAGIAVVTVPITLSYLGSERFGLWMAISSIVAVLGFADFGIGNGVMNAVADAHGKNDLAGIRSALSSGAAILSAVAATLAAGFLAVYPLVDWARVFNVHSPVAKAEAGPALLVFALCFALNILVGLALRAQMGLQEGFRSYLWQLAGQIAGLSGIFIVIHFHGGLPLLVLALAGSPIVAAVLNGILFFGISHRELLPSPRCVSRPAVRKVSHLGVLFFVLQVVGAFAFFSDNFIIIRILGPEEVTQYAVPQRMFTMIAMVLAMATAPLWPAYAEAISRGDSAWVQRTLVRSLKLAMVVAGLGVVTLICGGREIIHLWVGSKIAPPSYALLIGLGVWTLFDVAGNAVAMFLNGANVIKFQVIVAITFGIVCVTAKILALRSYGIAVLPWATAFTYCFLVAAPTAIVLPRLISRLHRRQAENSAANS